jgi:hypothetical protein
MQRALAYALSPARGLPLRFLLAAPWFGVLAALLLLVAGGSAFVSRWSAPALAATHLLTLGYLGMSMAGSMLQLIPVVTGRAVPLGRTGAALAWHGLALGALLLACALGLNATSLFMPAALLLAGALATLIAATARALARDAPAPAMPMVRGMRLAVAGLAVTLVLGVTLAFALAGALAAPVLMLTDLHAAWGLLGWVAMLVVGVAFQVIPMFQSARTYPAPVTRWAPWLLAGLLAAWSGATLGGHAGAAPAAMLLCAALAAFAVLSGRAAAGRIKPAAGARPAPRREALQRGRSALSAFVGTQARHVDNGDLAALHRDHAVLGQLVQHARKILRRQVQARGEQLLADREGDLGAIADRVVLEQVADDALAARAQRIRFDVLDQAMQAPAHPGQHAARERRIVFELAEHGLLADMEQHGVGQRGGADDVGLFHEHQRFAEAEARSDDLDDLLVALHRQEAELDLAVDDDVEAAARVAAAKDGRAARRMQLLRLGGERGQLLRAEVGKQRQPLEEFPAVDPGREHGASFK